MVQLKFNKHIELSVDNEPSRPPNECVSLNETVSVGWVKSKILISALRTSVTKKFEY